jgi:hypothetical protein
LCVGEPGSAQSGTCEVAAGACARSGQKAETKRTNTKQRPGADADAKTDRTFMAKQSTTSAINRKALKLARCCAARSQAYAQGDKIQASHAGTFVRFSETVGCGAQEGRKIRILTRTIKSLSLEKSVRHGYRDCITVSGEQVSNEHTGP